jgi:antitoxin (DNA-binding transcriptional repressor) of toxin-antitoxin stability system
MTIQMNIAEAKAKLSALIEAALKGEEVIIARDGKALVHLKPIEAKPVKRFGILKDYGYTHDVPFEAFAPEPEDAIESPLDPDDPNS